MSKKPNAIKLVRVGTASITNCDACGGTHTRVDVFLKGDKYVVTCSKKKQEMEFTHLK